MMPERQPKKKAISICHFRFHLGRLWLFWDWDFFLVLLFRERFCVFSPASKFRWNFFRFAEIVAMKWLSGKVQKKRRSSNENSACCHVCSRFSPRTSRRDMKAGNVLKETERSSLLYGNPESAQGAPKEIKQFLSCFQDLLTWRLIQENCNLALNPFTKLTEMARIQFHLASSYPTSFFLLL